MRDYTRRAVAYIVGRLVSGKEVFAIYDYFASRNFQFTGKVTLGTISVYDPEQKCSLNGSEKAGLYIIHRDDERYIEFTVKEDRFQGYDFETHESFFGTVRGNLISIHDPEHSRLFDYSL